MCPSSRERPSSPFLLEILFLSLLILTSLPLPEKICQSKMRSVLQIIGHRWYRSASELVWESQNQGMVWAGGDLKYPFPAPRMKSSNFAVVFRGTQISLQVFTRLWSCLSERTLLAPVSMEYPSLRYLSCRSVKLQRALEATPMLRGLSAQFSLLIKV